MERTLQEVEQNTMQEKQQDVAAGKLYAAPLLQRWQRQKRQAQATKAFEQEFLPGASSAREILPSFLEEVEAAGEEGSMGEDAGVYGGRGETEADRALRFVKQLKQQKEQQKQLEQERQQQRLRRQQQQAQMQREGKQRQRQQQQRQQQAAAISADDSTSSSSSTMPIVEDLITHIPPAPSFTTDSAGTAAASTSTSDLLAAAVAAVDAEQGSMRASSSTTVSETLTEILQQAEAAVAGLAQLRGQAGAPLEEDQQAPQQQQQVTTDGARSSLEQIAPEAAQQQQPHGDLSDDRHTRAADEAIAGVEEVGRRYAASISSTSSMGSLGEVLREAEAVLRQLPEGIQAAIAADEASLDHESSFGSLVQAGARLQQPKQGQQQGVKDRSRATAVDESATSVEAAAILEELKQLQRELGVQVGLMPGSI
jgi:hypothetical protein